MYRPNDATGGHQQPMEAAGEWGASAAQDAWRPDYTTNRGFRHTSRDNFDMEDELNSGLNFDIYDHNDHRSQNGAVRELNSGANRLDDATSDLRNAIRSLRHGDTRSCERLFARLTSRH